MKETSISLFLGTIMGYAVWLMERTTNEVAWSLVLSFPVAWGVAGYLSWRWNLFGTRRKKPKRLLVKEFSLNHPAAIYFFGGFLLLLIPFVTTVLIWYARTR